MSLRQPALRFKRALIASVLLAFVWAQALGLMHRVVHAPFVGYGAGPASAEAPQTDVSRFKALFAGHDGERSCDLYEQSSHADLACGHALVLALQGPGTGGEQLHPGWLLVAQAAGFLARGPPSLV